jgi:hypothetical protein
MGGLRTQNAALAAKTNFTRRERSAQHSRVMGIICILYRCFWVNRYGARFEEGACLSVGHPVACRTPIALNRPGDHDAPHQFANRQQRFRVMFGAIKQHLKCIFNAKIFEDDMQKNFGMKKHDVNFACVF